MKTILTKSILIICICIISLFMNTYLFSQNTDEVIPNPISEEDEIQLQEKIKSKDRIKNIDMPAIPTSAIPYTFPSLTFPGTTIQSVINVLEGSGISGNGAVEITVPSGIYSERPIIHNIPGTDFNSHVIFKSAALNTVFVWPFGSLLTTDYGIWLAGADYITFDNINVYDGGCCPNDQIEYGYLITNDGVGVNGGAQNNIIKNARIVLGGGGASSPPGFSHGVLQSTITGATQTNDNNTYEKLTIENSDRGIGVFGLTGGVSPHEQNIKITGCKLGQFWSLGAHSPDNTGSAIGIVASNCVNVEISNNTVYNVISSSPTGTSPTYGIAAQNCNGNVFNNFVMNVTNANTTITGSIARPVGIQASGLLPQILTVYNNFVTGIKKSYSGPANTTVGAVGIRTTSQGGAGVIKYYFNTVYLNANNAPYTSAAFASFAGNINFEVINNIFYNNIAAIYPAAGFAIVDENIMNNFYTGNYNDLYTGGSSTIGRKGSTGSVNLYGWRTKTVQDFTSISKNVIFAGAGDLHLSGTSITDGALIGMNIPGILTDIDNDPRNLPTIGADEGEADITLFKILLGVNFQSCNNEYEEIVLELREAANPDVIVESRVGFGGQGFPSEFYFANAAINHPYYLVVRHKNSIETWSILGGSYFDNNSSMLYIFTDPFSAYPSLPDPPNEIYITPFWSIYSGDVDQDGIVDATDLSNVDNDTFRGFPTTYPTDLNCDGYVDNSDLSKLENNIGITVKRP